MNANTGNLKTFYIICRVGTAHRNELIFMEKAGNARPTNLSFISAC